MSFASESIQLELAQLTNFTQKASAKDVETALSRAVSKKLKLADFAALISPAANQPEYLEELANQSHRLTTQHFGRVMRLFAPLYLSNECINICKYCGFSRNNPILRVTLSLDQVLQEARFLRAQGFRHILLVAGEHPHFVSTSYLSDCVRLLREDWPSISLEVAPMETDQYRPIVEAGAEGLIVYQETYDRTTYGELHTSGPKTNYDWRLETPERAYAAGFKRLGIGVLLGLVPWRNEALQLAAHVGHLLRQCWQSQITISLPRLRPAPGEFNPTVQVTDREFVQLICALRILFPEVGIVLSTRESPKLRDALIPLGVTMMSAGSHTEPGGYTGQAKDDIHYTTLGRQIKPPTSSIDKANDYATGQFEIADNRSPAQVAEHLACAGYEPVWKDWDTVLNET